ncbi:MAG TPA: hypothetical protein VHZ33_29360 [Trebonia sp.]|nr:hypothetical protein [Trebonia sp.]
MKPIAASRSRKAARSGATAAAVWSRPNAAAAITITRIRGRCPAAASTAPTAEPSPTMMLNRP